MTLAGMNGDGKCRERPRLSRVKRLQDFQMKHQAESDYYDDNGAQYNESAKEAPLPAFERHPKFCSSTKWGTGNRLDAANAKIHERNGEWNHCEWALELKTSRSCKNNATDQKSRSQKSPQKLDCTFAANCPWVTRRCFDRRCHRGAFLQLQDLHCKSKFGF